MRYLILVLILTVGCSALSIKQQESYVKNANLIISEAKNVVNMYCAAPVEEEKQRQCALVSKSIALLQDSLDIYSDTLVEMSYENSTKEQVIAAIGVVISRVAILQISITNLIEAYKDTE